MSKSKGYPFDRNRPERITVELAMELTGADFMRVALHPTYDHSTRTISSAAIMGLPDTGAPQGATPQEGG